MPQHHYLYTAGMVWEPTVCTAADVQQMLHQYISACQAWLNVIGPANVDIKDGGSYGAEPDPDNNKQSFKSVHGQPLLTSSFPFIHPWEC